MITCHPEEITFFVRSTAGGERGRDWPTDGQYAVYNDAPVALTVTNTDSHQSLVFHTRTNFPGQFTVKHREGLLGPGESATVLVSLRKRLPKLESSARFLVQCAVNNMVPSADVMPEEDIDTASEERNKEDAEMFRQRQLDTMRKRFQLGKAWRGRNLDLDGSASVIVRCDVKHQPPWIADVLNENTSLHTEIRAVRQELEGLGAELQAAKRQASEAVETRGATEATRSEATTAHAAAVKADEQVEAREAVGQRGYNLMEGLVLVMLVCWTVVLALQV